MSNQKEQAKEVIEFLDSLDAQEDNVQCKNCYKMKDEDGEFRDGYYEYILYTDKSKYDDFNPKMTVYVENGGFKSVESFNGLGYLWKNEDEVPPKLKHYFPEGDKEHTVYGLPGFNKSYLNEGKNSMQKMKEEWEEFISKTKGTDIRG